MTKQTTEILLVLGGIVVIYAIYKYTQSTPTPTANASAGAYSYRGYTLMRNGSPVALNSDAENHIDSLLSGKAIASSDYATLQSDGQWTPALPPNGGYTAGSSSSGGGSVAGDIGEGLSIAALFI